MPKARYNPDMTMDDILRLWPETVPFVLANGMLCIGCPIAVFHTAYDACEAHEIAEGAFIGALTAIIEGKG